MTYALLLRRLAPYLLGLAGAVALWLAWAAYVAHVRSTARADQFATDERALNRYADDIRAKRIAAAKMDADHNAAVADEFARRRKESDDALQSQVADARARSDRWLREHAALTAARSRSGTAQLSTASGAAALPVGPDRPAVVSHTDFDRCVVGLTRLVNAKKWSETLDKVPQ